MSTEVTTTGDLAFDNVDKRRLDLIRKTVAKGATNEELASFLELCSKYDLDPFAHEAWCAISQRDGGNRNVLIMVGRAGLRKIAQRQGLRVDGDVVREKDGFKVTRNADRTRTIEHIYESGTEARGPIIGAWAEVYDEKGQRGYFYAPLSEYKPTNPNKLKYSPWGSQESTMILAAAERQAIAMATPLGGLSVDADAPVLEAGPAPEPPERHYSPGIKQVIERAIQLGHAGLSDLDLVDMQTLGLAPPSLADWIAESNAELDAFEAGKANA